MMAVEWILDSRTLRRFLFSLSALVITAFVSFSFVPSVHAAKAAVDKTGLDILCKCDGCEYHGPTTKVHHSQCIYPDGQVITCSNKTEEFIFFASTAA